MASLATGSVNFAKQIYDNHPDLVEGMARTMIDSGIKPEIEVFDLAMLYTTKAPHRPGPGRAAAARSVRARHPQRPAGAPRRCSSSGFPSWPTLMPGATWTAAGIGRHQLEVARWALARGGHVRTGLEDNLRYDKTRLAASNADLVAQVVDACPEYDRRPASPSEARQILGLPAA